MPPNNSFKPKPLRGRLNSGVRHRMQILTHAYSFEERQRIEWLLGERGIPTYSVMAGAGRWMTQSANQWVVYVCIDSQLPDALAVLKDPDHGVTDPVDVTAFNEALRSADTSPMAFWLLKATIMIVSVFSATIYLLWRSHSA
jgi:hypothetical protein